MTLPHRMIDILSVRHEMCPKDIQSAISRRRTGILEEEKSIRISSQIGIQKIYQAGDGTSFLRDSTIVELLSSALLDIQSVDIGGQACDHSPRANIVSLRKTFGENEP